MEAHHGTLRHVKEQGGSAGHGQGHGHQGATHGVACHQHVLMAHTHVAHHGAVHANCLPHRGTGQHYGHVSTAATSHRASGRVISTSGCQWQGNRCACITIRRQQGHHTCGHGQHGKHDGSALWSSSGSAGVLCRKTQGFSEAGVPCTALR